MDSDSADFPPTVRFPPSGGIFAMCSRSFATISQFSSVPKSEHRFGFAHHPTFDASKTDERSKQQASPTG